MIQDALKPIFSLLAKKLPVVGERYWVKCEGFRCMAVADYDGEWKVFPNGKKLTSTVLSYWQ
jgi:hypothetical protein